MYLMRNHDIWIYVRCANSDSRIAFDRLYDLIDEAVGHGFLVRGNTSRLLTWQRHLTGIRLRTGHHCQQP